MITRRHMLSITAAAGGVSLLNIDGFAMNAPHIQVATWRGIALGGTASMQILHEDAQIAQNMLKNAVTELKRLEQIFSLYDPASSLSKLNRDGYLNMPPIELVMLLKTARQISVASNGLFDVTVQPIWEKFESAAPLEPGIIIDQKQIKITKQKITLGQGQKITLNGIAQGAITDHLMALIKKNDFQNLLLETGEISALGQNKNMRPWRVALGNDDGPVVELNNAALATSEAIPLILGGSASHFFNPYTKLPENHFNRVSVIAPNATYADGLSTALMLCEENDWPKILNHFKSMSLRTYFERKDGTRV